MELRYRRRGLTLTAVVTLLSSGVTGCSALSFGSTPQASAETAIEERLATEYAITGVEATCDEPTSTEVGGSFACTAPTDLGEITWTAVFGEEQTIDVQPTNILDAATVANLETSAAGLIGDKVGMVLPTGSFDCGDLIVLNAEMTTICSVVDPASGDLYDATLQITDQATAAFTVAVADTPRAG